MVRCGHCLQAFNARPGFIPDQPNPQLELSILNEPVESAEKLPADEPRAAEAVENIGTAEETSSIEEAEAIEETASAGETGLLKKPA